MPWSWHPVQNQISWKGIIREALVTGELSAGLLFQPDSNLVFTQSRLFVQCQSCSGGPFWLNETNLYECHIYMSSYFFQMSFALFFLFFFFLLAYISCPKWAAHRGNFRVKCGSKAYIYISFVSTYLYVYGLFSSWLYNYIACRCSGRKQEFLIWVHIYLCMGWIYHRVGRG